LLDILKANDLRGVVPDQWDARGARALGIAIAEHLGGPVLVGRDGRVSGPELAQAMIGGITEAGRDAIDLGMCSTDATYFASGHLNLPGVMLTASHNPAEYNGMKLMRPGARPLGRDQGLGAIVERAQAILDGAPACPDPANPPAPGTATARAIIPEYAAYLRSLVDLTGIKPIKVVADAGNGMAGLTVPATLGTAGGLPALPIDLVPLYFETDGTFPNHPANPLDPANTVDLQKAVVANHADLGLAFDGDADRCFVIDNEGNVVDPGAICAIVGLGEMERDRAAGRQPVVIHNVITSRAVPEFIRAHGGEPVRTKVGHAFIKEIMAQRNACFGGEHSAHFYFRDFFYADTGLLAAMHVIRALDQTGGTMADLARAHTPYVRSGEINSRVRDIAVATARVRDAYAADAARGEVALDELDGLTVDHWAAEPKWWANVRPSNTEPLLRLNVEADDQAVMARVRDRVLALVREGEPQ
jgi:phosphomannomutase